MPLLFVHTGRWLQTSACTCSAHLTQNWCTARTGGGQASALKMSPFFSLKRSATRMRSAWCYRLQNKPWDFVNFGWSSADIRKLFPFRRGTRSQYMLRNKKLRDQSFLGSFPWPTICAKGRVRKRQSLGARWNKARRGLNSLGIREAFEKKMSLHWNKGLEPNWSQATGV